MIDASGSMGEEGKKSVVRYLIYAIEGLMKDLYPAIDYKIFIWNDEVIEYAGKIDFRGSANHRALSTFLCNHKDDSILIIGDGSYSEEVKKIIKDANDRMLFLMAGSDCNKARIHKMVGGESVYETVDIAACMNDFVCM